MTALFIGSLTLAALLVAAILIATGGKPRLLAAPLADTRRVFAQNRGGLAAFAASVFLVAAFLFLFYQASKAGIGPEQPIPFSHRLHAGVKAIACEFCHPYVRRSIHPGLPAVEKCLYCHNYIIPRHPWIRKEHEYFNTKTPIPWKEVFYLPEHVLFNHERHLKKEVRCQECHGAIETMDRLPKKRLKMGFCIACHQERKANLGCWLACHN